MNILVILFIILFYLLTPGILIKIKGNKYVIAIVHALLFSGIVTFLNSILNTRYEYMTDTSNNTMNDISNNKMNDISNNTMNNTNNTPKLMGMSKCPKYHVRANGGLESDCVKCPIVNGLPLGVMGKYALCAYSNSIDNRGYVETIEEGGTCSDSLDIPVSIGNDKKQFCISNTSIKTSDGLDKFNKITTPSNITYYQSN
jgi:hypothetical protein